MGKRTACEEAAEYYSTGFPALSKRLRAEGRKIVRYERLIVQAWGDGFDRFQQADAMLALAHAAQRIQKARKK